jgi:hypothetical protein
MLQLLLLPLCGAALLSLGEARTIRGRYVDVTVGAQTCDVLKYGAVGDGKTDDSKAIQKALDACGKGGGGTVVLAGRGC